MTKRLYSQDAETRMRDRMYTKHDIATMLSRTEQTIRKTAVRYGLGTKVHYRLTLYSEDDLKRLKELCHGKGGVKPYLNRRT